MATDLKRSSSTSPVSNTEQTRLARAWKAVVEQLNLPAGSHNGEILAALKNFTRGRGKR